MTVVEIKVHKTKYVWTNRSWFNYFLDLSVNILLVTLFKIPFSALC